MDLSQYLPYMPTWRGRREINFIPSITQQDVPSLQPTEHPVLRQDYRPYELPQLGLRFKQRTVGSEIKKYFNWKERKSDAVPLCPPHSTYTALGRDMGLRVEYPLII